MAKADFALSPGLSPAREQPGWMEIIRSPQPAAGANFAHTIDGRFGYRVDAITFTLTTDAVVANRIPVIDYVTPAGEKLYEVSASNTVVAASAINVFAMTQYAPSLRTATGGNYIALPDTILEPSWQIQVNVGGIDPGDQLSGIVIRTWRFPWSLMVPYVEG